MDELGSNRNSIIKTIDANHMHDYMYMQIAYEKNIVLENFDRENLRINKKSRKIRKFYVNLD